MRRRVVILTEIIAPYRIPVFNALATREGIDLHVIFLAENDPTLRQWLVYKDEIRFSYQVLPSWRWRLGKQNILLNRGLGGALRRAAPDAILCGGYNYLASWQSLWWARRHRVPFLLWVESTARDLRGNHCRSNPSKEVSCAVASLHRARQIILRIPDGVWDAGECIFTAPNAVDTEFFERRADAARRTPRPTAKRCACPHVTFSMSVGWLRKKECLICCRPMAHWLQS